MSGTYWLCDGHSIRRIEVPFGQNPQGTSLYSAFSMYYCEGFGFWITRGDATTHAEAWRPLTFEHDDREYSSYLTNAGPSGRLRCQRPDQQWPKMLLPDIYQTHPMPTHQAYGGLKGDLAILLALIALSMSREDLQQYLTGMFLNETWQVHGLPHGRKLFPNLKEALLTCVGLHQRGVVVYVYTCAPCAPLWIYNSTPNEMARYENGGYNHYYN